MIVSHVSFPIEVVDFYGGSLTTRGHARGPYKARKAGYDTLAGCSTLCPRYLRFMFTHPLEDFNKNKMLGLFGGVFDDNLAGLVICDIM